MIVRISKDWKFPDIMRQTPGGKGNWNGIQFTEERSDDCDVLVVLNRPVENIITNVRRGGAWLFSQESPIPIYEWHKKSFPHFDYVFTFWEQENFGKARVIHDQTSLPWHVNKSYDELKSLEPQKGKRNELSWVTSNASHKEGHKIRMNFLDYLRLQNYPLHLYGRGFDPIEEKYDAIAPFKYSLAIENFSCRDYWTEKLADCFLSWTLPVYYGCTNISDYFPGESMLLIDARDPRAALEQIKSAIAGNEWEKRLEAIREARNLILEKYQFFPAVAEKIGKFVETDRKRLVIIPGNNQGEINSIPAYIRLKSKLVNLFS